MPRVREQTRSARGAERKCGAPGCGKTIQPGERYLSWSFRYGGTRYRCLEHPPKQSELTQSKLSTVYAAVEAADDALDGTETVEDVKDLVQEVVDAAREVAEEYREAAEPFGGQGENAERADELEGWADELEGFEPDEPEEAEFDEAEAEDLAKDMVVEELDLTYNDAMARLRQEWEDEHEGDADALETARAEARELIGGCPL